MRGVEVSELNLDTDGRVAVKSLATIYEDGEVVGQSYLASSLRKSVEARGPVPLGSVLRLYNNGYYGASEVNKDKTYIREHSEAPVGTQVKEGPRGGLYYEAEPQQDMPDTVKAFEARVLGDDYESALIAMTSGKVLEDKTDNKTNSVSFDRYRTEGGFYEGAIMSHNHPGGAAFSAEDLAMGLKAGMREVRAVARPQAEWPYYHTFRLRITKSKDENMYNATRIQAAVHNSHVRLRSRFTRAIDRKKMTTQQAERMHMRVVWKMARRELTKYGIFYEVHKYKNPDYAGVVKAREDATPTEGPKFHLDLSLAIPLYGPDARPDLWEKRFKMLTAWLSGGSTLSKGRVYLKPDQQAPEGMHVKEGPRGGRYYETTRGRGRPRRQWKTGDRVKINSPWTFTHQMSGTIRRFEVSGADASDDPHDVAVVDVEIPGKEGGRYFIKLDMLVSPGTKVSKRSREQIRMEAMGKARDAVTKSIEANIKSFREASFYRNTTWILPVSPHEHLSYSMAVDKTDDGIEIWSPHEDQTGHDNLDVSDAPSRHNVIKALSYMPPKAIRDLKHYVTRIVMSPIRNPRDEKMTRITGRNFTSAATMDMQTGEMVMYPTTRGNLPHGLASIMTHETGHMVDARRKILVDAFSDRRYAFWDEMKKRGIKMPVSDEGMKRVEAEHGLPQHPNEWMRGYTNWIDFDRGSRNPDMQLFWGWYPLAEQKRGAGPGGWPPAEAQLERGVMIGQASWNELTREEKSLVTTAARRGEPVSNYARTNEKEYYSEAYEHYRYGTLPKSHMMYTHFKNMEVVDKWLDTP